MSEKRKGFGLGGDEWVAERNRVEEPKEGASFLDGREWTHPAYGQISAGRVTSSAGEFLYGSDFKHRNFIVLRIARSSLVRSISSEHFHQGEEIVEVSLSEGQWATFVSSLNAGSGVPCTIGHVLRVPAPRIPERTESREFERDFSAKLDKLRETVRETIAEVEGEIGAKLSKSAREKILGKLRFFEMDVDKNMPFLAQQFGEYMESTKDKAKIEIHAYASNAVHAAGLAALGIEGGALRLTSGKDTPAEGELLDQPGDARPLDGGPILPRMDEVRDYEIEDA